jgi:hypothetical protein
VPVSPYTYRKQIIDPLSHSGYTLIKRGNASVVQGADTKKQVLSDFFNCSNRRAVSGIGTLFQINLGASSSANC